MQITERVRRVKQFLSTMHEQMSNHTLEGNTLGVRAGIRMAKGDISQSEALSFIEAIKAAVSKFSEDDVVEFDFDFEIITPDQKSIVKGVQESMQKVVELEANANAAKNKIVSAR